MEDLSKEISEAQEEGDQIIICGDFNLDVNSQEMTDFLEQHDLFNPITTRYGKEGPPTYNRGSKQIDAILLSNQLWAYNGGYLPTTLSPGDHRVVWVDIPLTQLYGDDTPPQPWKSGRKLQLNNARTITRYIQRFKKLTKEKNLYKDIELLFREAMADPSSPRNLSLIHI